MEVCFSLKEENCFVIISIGNLNYSTLTKQLFLVELLRCSLNDLLDWFKGFMFQWYNIIALFWMMVVKWNVHRSSISCCSFGWPIYLALRQCFSVRMTLSFSTSNEFLIKLRFIWSSFRLFTKSGKVSEVHLWCVRIRKFIFTLYSF